MDITERELHDFIFDQQCFSPEETNFDTEIEFIRTEYVIGESRLDILGVDRSRNFYVIELKKGVVDGNAIVQAMSYVSELKEMLDVNEINYNQIRIIVVGKDIEKRAETVVIGNENIDFVRYVPVFNFEPITTVFKHEFFEKLKKQSAELLNEINNRDVDILYKESQIQG